MKRLVALLLLISHMNTSMFLPQVPLHDIFDEEGNQIDDINSVIEFVMVSFGLDNMADDEDNDQGQNFNIVNPPCLIPPQSEKLSNPFVANKRNHYSIPSNARIALMAYDIIIPPPKIV